MPVERNFSPNDQEAHTIQPQQETLAEHRANKSLIKRLRGIKQVGQLMAVMLTANLGLVGATKTPDSHEHQVDRQTVVDLLNGTGSFETPASAPPMLPCAQISSPQGWCALPHGVNVPNPNFDYQNGFNYDGYNSVDTDGYITDASCNTDTNSWEQSFAATPGNTYTLSFANYMPPGSSPDLNPRVIITWKNGTTTLDTDDHTFNRTSGPNFWENDFSRTYGPSGVVIPAGTTSGELQLGVGSTKTSSCIVGTTGKQYFDVVTVMGPAPTPPSVGGIAEMPNPETLPADSNSSDNNSELKYAISGIVIGTLAAGAAGWKIRSMNRENYNK